MPLKYNQLESLLVEAFAKKAPSQNVPTEITDKIMMYYYHSNHKENFPMNLVIDAVFLWKCVQRCDPENTCQTLLKCNCCKRHQKQKGNVYTSDKTGELEISAITKPEVFIPDFKYTGNKPPTHYWHGQEAVDRYYNHPGDATCYCHCRQITRNCVRQVLVKKLGRKLTRHEMNLNIRRSRAYHAPPPGPLVEAPQNEPYGVDFEIEYWH